MSIELIGAGLPRTGTLTQKLALEELGLSPCYHWVNLLTDLDQVELWDRAMDGEVLWEQIFDEARSTADWPGGFFYRQLMGFYPQAKVLLSVREPESWERSFRETIWTLSFGETVMPLLSRARAQIDPRWQRYLAIAHNEQVKRVVPAERLLVWQVTDGWEPLCEFLEVDVPDSPFPRANDRDTYLERVIDGALGALGAWRESGVPVAG